MAVTLTAAGCGSSSSSSPSSSPAAWRTKVNSICASNNAKVTAQPASETQSVAGLSRLYNLQKQAVAQVEAVTPPDSLKNQAQTWLNTVRQSEANAGQLLNGLQSGNRAQLQPLLARAQTLSAQEKAQANGLGLNSCAANAQPSAR